jgi:hypothetical protein
VASADGIGHELYDAGQNYYSTTIKHYVETEDTMDNLDIANSGRCTDRTGKAALASDGSTDQAACVTAGGSWTPGYVQRNKHGGIYTYGNLERFPFGRNVPSTDPVNALAAHHETGFTVAGYSSYESLYGYVAGDALNAGTPCGPTEMGATTLAIAGALWDNSSPPLTGVEPAATRVGTGTQAGNTGAAKP